MRLRRGFIGAGINEIAREKLWHWSGVSGIFGLERSWMLEFANP